MLNTYNIFISHSWRYSNHHITLVNFLKERPFFNFKDYSVPVTNPIIGVNTNKGLMEALRNQIRPAQVFLLPAGVYVTHSRWIKEEIQIAKDMGKPIIGIIPWGQQNISSLAYENCDKIVGWNTESIVSAIRELV